MNKLQRREAVLPGVTSLLAFCESYSSQITGSSEGYLTEQDLTKGDEFIQVCLDTWESGTGIGKGYDEAVRRLLIALQGMIRDEVNRRESQDD